MKKKAVLIGLFCSLLVGCSAGPEQLDRKLFADQKDACLWFQETDYTDSVRHKSNRSKQKKNIVDLVNTTESQSYFVSAVRSESSSEISIERGMAVSIGSGTDRCYLLTNAHVVAGAESISINARSEQGKPGPQIKANIQWIAEDIDAALVNYSHEGGCPHAHIREELPKLGENIHAYGQPSPGKGIVSTGSVAGWWNIEQFGEVIVSDLFALPGHSGSGVFSEEGHLVGVLSGRTEDQPGYSYTMPICRIINRLPEISNIVAG